MRRIGIICLLLLATSAFADAAKLTTVILVRHAEKVSGAPAMTDDPALSEAGKQRAEELARVLAGTKVDAIYTTQYLRTKATAEPLGAALKVTPQVFEADKTYASRIAAKIRNDHRGQTVVVVGHSNTTQNVMKELGVADAPAIAESTFDNLFVVTFSDAAAPSLVALRYGAVAR